MIKEGTYYDKHDDKLYVITDKLITMAIDDNLVVSYVLKYNLDMFKDHWIYLGEFNEC